VSGYGLLAEFDSPDALLAAVRAAREAGYRQLEAFAPFAVEGLDEALQLPRSRVPLLALLGGIAGAGGGFFLQWYSAVVDFPINSGGRPLDSWPAFVPAMVELGILGASLAAFAGMLLLNGLPRLRHPVFEAAPFARASRDRFFLCIRGADPRFDAQRTHAWLQQRAALSITVLPAEAP